MKKLHLCGIVTILFCLSINLSYATKNSETLTNTTINQLKDTCLVGDCVSGFSIKITAQNHQLIGNFENGQLKGYGIHYAYKHLFIGEFKNGKRNGYGTLKTSSKTLKGKWSNNQYVSSNFNEHYGCQSGDCQNGNGIYIYTNNTIYIGDFINGQAEGEGVCLYSDGDVYYGNWSNHTFHGKGNYYFLNTNELKTGFWENGKYAVAERKPQMRTISTQNNIPQKTQNESEIWAVVVGAAQYRHMQSLKFTDDDAYGLYSFLCSPEGGAVHHSNIKLLIDESATKDNITDALKTFAAKADENDVLLFYYSGHGLPDAFLPIDYDGTHNKLFHKNLVPIFKSSKAKSKIIIADACHSGGMLAYKGKDYETSMNNYYNEIEKSQGGLVMFLSSKAEETSIENNGLRQGIFTHFLMRGLYGAANSNNDQIIRLDELFEYVQNNVRFYTNDYQTPMIYGNKSINHPIAIIRD